MVTSEKAIEMINEYIAETNSIHREWLEALMLCKTALEKQIPKKCKLFKDSCVCGKTVYPHMDYCDKCGQALDCRKEDEGK